MTVWEPSLRTTLTALRLTGDVIEQPTNFRANCTANNDHITDCEWGAVVQSGPPRFGLLQQGGAKLLQTTTNFEINSHNKVVWGCHDSWAMTRENVLYIQPEGQHLKKNLLTFENCIRETKSILQQIVSKFVVIIVISPSLPKRLRLILIWRHWMAKDEELTVGRIVIGLLLKYLCAWPPHYQFIRIHLEHHKRASPHAQW